MAMRVLMLGWELPPYNSGGLGVACLGLARSLANQGVAVTFVLPQKQKFNIDFLNLVFADIKFSDKLESSYTPSILFEELKLKNPISDFVSAALLFGKRVGEIAGKYNPDIIHAHDWLPYPAAIAAKKVTDYSPKPLFAVAGSGDMQEKMIAEASYLVIMDKVMFSGFLRGDE